MTISFHTLAVGLAGLVMTMAPLCYAKSLKEGVTAPRPGQIHIPWISQMPNFPRPYKIRNWKQVARDFDALAFDLTTKGKYRPLMRLLPPEANPNTKTAGFGMTSYVGPDPENENALEAITNIAAVLSGTYVGIDKTKGPHDFVRMCQQYYNSANGKNMVLNHINDRRFDSFWYSLFPAILYFTLDDQYPGIPGNDLIVRNTADQWLKAATILSAPDNPRGFDYTCFDFTTMKPRNNKMWTEPDSAAGMGWVLYAAYLKFQEPKYLKAAQACLDYLQVRPPYRNPYYEVQLPFGAYCAARMNAEQGTDYDIYKLLNWCFEHSSVVRPDMAVIAENWEGRDCAGLVGSRNRPPWRKPGGGYAFTMNTFAMAMALMPLVRYDDRFATTLGKWFLNAANAARYFYANEHAPDNQSCPEWKEDKNHVIAYEGIRHHWSTDKERFYATGDPVEYKWGYKTDFSLYGSSFVGVFGGMVKTTDVDYVLAVDLSRTAFRSRDAWPAYLVYNPHVKPKAITISLPPGRHDLYDTTTDAFVARNAEGKATVTIDYDLGKVIVLLPAGIQTVRQGNKTMAGGRFVDYR